MSVKRAIRQRLRRYRRSLPRGQRRRAEAHILEATLTELRRRGARRIACYLDSDGEVATRGLIRALWAEGREAYLPAVRGRSRTLAFRRYTPQTPLRRNRYGVPEPPPGRAPEVPVRRLDAVLAPLVAFDPAGRRLGMGGGYYDATFAFLRGRSWQPPSIYGLAFAAQQVPELPGEPWDLPLAGVITERGCVRLPQKGWSRGEMCRAG